MAYTGFTHLIRPTAGQTVPVNEVGGAAYSPTGGVLTLQDVGGGVRAWRTGSASTNIPITSRTLNCGVASTDQGIAIAVRFRENAVGSFSVPGFLSAFGLTNSGDASTGLRVTRATLGEVAGLLNNAQSPNLVLDQSQFRTYVLTITPNDSTAGGGDKIRLWAGRTGRVGTAPDAVNADGAVIGNAVINNILMAVGGGPPAVQFDHLRAAVWMTAVTLTAAEAAALADADAPGAATASGFDALLGVGGGGDTTPPVITGPGGAIGSTASITVAAGATVVFDYSANEAATWDKNGGANQALFNIDPVTGVLAFAAPAVAGTYVVGVRATDQAAPSNATTQTLTVTVTAPAGGTITTSRLVRNTGAAATDPWIAYAPGEAFTVFVHHISTGALLVKRTGLLTSAQGMLAFTDAAVPAAPAYRLDYQHEATGVWGMEIVPAV